jgi:hypothetical protein
VRAGDLLRDLDRRLLPPLARGLDRLAGRGLAAPARPPWPLMIAVFASAAAAAVVLVSPAVHRPPAAPQVATVARVGVVDGQSIPAYLASSRSELARLVADRAAPTYALVSLKAYLAPDRLAAALAGVGVDLVYTRVPLPGRQTEITQIPVGRVPADVVAGMAAVAGRKDQEAATYAALSAKLTGDGAQERRLRAVYAGSAQLAVDEAAAYRARCSCVYAAVVQGAPAALAGVADRPEVRVVDPAPEVRRVDQAVFLPPLPEQTGVVHLPADRMTRPTPNAEPRRDRPARTDHPAPAGTPSPAPSSAAAQPSRSGQLSPSAAARSPVGSKIPSPSTSDGAGTPGGE